MSEYWQPFAVSEQDEILEPFAVSEQDEILEQLGRTMPVLKEEATKPAAPGAFDTRTVCRTRTHLERAPRCSGRACGCLTPEEHLSGGCVELGVRSTRPPR